MNQNLYELSFEIIHGLKCPTCRPAQMCDNHGTQEEQERVVELLREYLARYRAIRDAATRLADRLREIHADGRYRGVWEISQIHVGPYTGPTYTAELEALERALSE